LLRQALPVLRGGNWNVVVPVPLHPTKLREREFNQAARLGGHLARALGVPLAEKALRRVRPTRTQTLLTRQQRAENMRRAFGPGRGADAVRGRGVVLVDDVLTTGATTNACAEILRKAGAADVCVWTVARGI
jgi:ComF family protein